jgi:microcompartment protein CcmK/EutM
MKLARVIGRVVSTKKVESFEGLKLLLIQPLDENLEKTGDAIVAIDNLSAGVGELVYYETSKEASRILETTMNPADAAIMGIVDIINLQDKK